MKPIKHKPLLIKAVSWSEIEKHYEDSVSLGLEFKEMVSLVKYIRQSNLAGRLYAYTSLHKLIVTIYDVPEWHREELHIEYSFRLKEWHFAFYPRPDQPVEKEKIYTGINGITAFLKYIELLKW